MKGRKQTLSRRSTSLRRVEGVNAPLNEVVGCFISYARIIRSNEKPELPKTQADWSEYMGFNRRLLSKYEAGSVNLTLTNLAYVLSFLDVELYIFQEGLRDIARRLAQKNIYTSMDSKSLPITSEGIENLESMAYAYVYEWLNLDIELDITKETNFYIKGEIGFYDLKKIIYDFLDEINFKHRKITYREGLIKSLLEENLSAYTDALYKVAKLSKSTTELETIEQLKSVHASFKSIRNNLIYNSNNTTNRYYTRNLELEESYNDLTDVEEPLEDVNCSKDTASEKVVGLQVDLFSSSKIHLPKQVEDLADVSISVHTLEEISKAKNSNIAVVLISSEVDISRLSLIVAKMVIVILANEVTIIDKTILADFIVYRLEKEEDVNEIFTMLFHSLIRTYFCQNIDEIFIEPEEVREVLRFGDGNFLRVNFISHRDLIEENLPRAVIDNVEKNGDFLISLKTAKSSFSEGPDVTMNILFERFGSEFDGNIFFNVAFEQDREKDEIQLIFTSSMTQS